MARWEDSAKVLEEALQVPFVNIVDQIKTE